MTEPSRDEFPPAPDCGEPSEHDIAWPSQFDDDLWDVFLSDGDSDPLPEENDFWIEPD